MRNFFKLSDNQNTNLIYRIFLVIAILFLAFTTSGFLGLSDSSTGDTDFVTASISINERSKFSNEVFINLKNNTSDNQTVTVTVSTVEMNGYYTPNDYKDFDGYFTDYKFVLKPAENTKFLIKKFGVEKKLLRHTVYDLKIH